MFNVIKQAIEEVFDEKGVATREDLKYLPSKEEYYKREDEMMAELKNIREELTVQSGELSDHSDRIEKMEKIHPNGKHFSAI